MIDPTLDVRAVMRQARREMARVVEPGNLTEALNKELEVVRCKLVAALDELVALFFRRVPEATALTVSVRHCGVTVHYGDREVDAASSHDLNDVRLWNAITDSWRLWQTAYPDTLALLFRP